VPVTGSLEVWTRLWKDKIATRIAIPFNTVDVFQVDTSYTRKRGTMRRTLQ
jgi:hypothetical protein